MSVSINTSFVHLLHKCSVVAGAVLKTVNAPDDLSLRKFAFLATIYESPDLMQTEIVERSGVDRSPTTELMRRLLRAKLVSRRRAPKDTRAYLVRLTPLGEQKLFEMNTTINRSTNNCSQISPRRPGPTSWRP